MLISFLEEEFGIRTQDSDLIEENFESINAITDFIQKKKPLNMCGVAGIIDYRGKSDYIPAVRDASLLQLPGS